ncbi:hypothetical protein T484DRAFT_1792826 [Baffinella frigidus]|nr:hypothetical protein T484DRAFT_1792826 [Cryptophyta sp. CCMP2293]
MGEVDLALLGLQPGTLIWGQLGKNWWPGRVAWLKKAPKEVRENVKEECVLVHWFDEWEEVSSKPTRWAYGWLPVSKIKDFEGGFASLSKSRKSKIFTDSIEAALSISTFKPDGWARPEPAPTKKPAVEASEKPAVKAAAAAVPSGAIKPLTERQQLKALGVKMAGDSESEEVSEEEDEVEGAAKAKAKEGGEEVGGGAKAGGGGEAEGKGDVKDAGKSEVKNEVKNGVKDGGVP